MSDQASELGVDIFPGFAADEVYKLVYLAFLFKEQILYENEQVVGVATGDLGISKKGELKETFTRGVELRGDQTIFAEGARGKLKFRGLFFKESQDLLQKDLKESTI